MNIKQRQLQTWYDYVVDLNNNPDCGSDGGVTAPLLMLIGYTNGVQMWIVAVSA